MSRETQNETRAQKLKRLLVEEMMEYFINFAYLATFLVAFAWYRRLILATYHIKYLAYGAPLIEAAILAKVIMVGDVLHLGRRFRSGPLAITAIYRSIVFALLVIVFSVLEHMVGAMMHGHSAREGLQEIANKGLYEFLAWFIVVLSAFVPFFMLKEIERVFGVAQVRHCLFLGRSDNHRSERPPETKSE